MKKKNEEITLKGLIKIFLPGWWIILIVSILFCAAMGGYSYMQNDTYTSRGKFMVVKVNMSDNTAQTGLNEGEIKAMQAMVSNFSEIIDTENFAKQVVDKLLEVHNIQLSTGQVKSMMSVSLSGQDTTCYYFTVKANSPVFAHAVADVAGQLLVQEYQEMTKYAINIEKIDDPTVPVNRDGKNTMRNCIIGFVAGVFVSMILVFVINRFDVVVRSRDKIEENFNLPILGVIPRLEIDNSNKSKDKGVI